MSDVQWTQLSDITRTVVTDAFNGKTVDRNAAIKAEDLLREEFNNHQFTDKATRTPVNNLTLISETFGDKAVRADAPNQDSPGKIDHKLDLPNGVNLTDTTNAIPNESGSRQFIQLTDGDHEKLEFALKPYCNTEHQSVLGNAELIAVSKVVNGKEERKVVGDDTPPKTVIDCKAITGP